MIGNHALALATLIFAAERQAHAEAKRLLAAALERIPPQLEAPRIAGEPRSKETPYRKQYPTNASEHGPLEDAQASARL